MVLRVWNAILISVRLKMFVINVVSLPVYVNVSHFCFPIGLGSVCLLSFRQVVSVDGLGMSCFLQDVVDDFFFSLVLSCR